MCPIESLHSHLLLLQGKAATKKKRKRKAMDSTDESEEDIPSEVTVSGDLVSDVTEPEGLQDEEDTAPESKPPAASSEHAPGEGHS